MRKCKSSNYINWDFNATGVSPFEMNKILDEYGIDMIIPCKDNGQPQTEKIKYITSKNGVCVCQKKNCEMFYFVRREKVKVPYKSGYMEAIEYKPYCYKVSPNNYNTTAEGCNPLDIFRKFQHLFKEANGVSFSNSFRKTPEINFKNCIPKPINYGAYNFEPYLHVYKADISSAYSYEVIKKIPTANNMLVIDGFEKPNEEYPFAFYPKEGCLEVYGENIKANIEDAEKTYLMKASEVGFKKIVEKIYDLKEKSEGNERQMYKDMLNIPIGYFQKNDNPAYAYITAVVIARCNERVDTWAKYLESKGNRVILINTDSIAWDGKDCPEIYTTEKGIGNFILENKEALAFVKGPKCYQIKQNGIVSTKYAGLPKKFHDEIPFGGIMNIDRDLEAAFWVPDKVRYDFETINDFYILRGKKDERH